MKTYKFILNKDYDRVKDFFKEKGFSSNLIKSLSKEMGQVLKNEKPIRMNEKVNCGDNIKINIIESEKNNIIPIYRQINIDYEDENYLIVFKDYGIATIPSYCNNENSLANFITKYMQQKGQIDFVFRAFNRLDKETSGYVLICKDLISYNFLLKEKSQVLKKYEVITHNKLSEQQICKPILTKTNASGRNELKRIIDINGKPSITNILCVHYNLTHNISYATISLETGRTHQIRLHLSSINCPILGDKLYGIEDCNKLNIEKRMYLNCYHLEFYHPFKNETIIVENKLFEKVFNELN